MLEWCRAAIRAGMRRQNAQRIGWNSRTAVAQYRIIRRCDGCAIAHGTAARIDVGAPMAGVERNLGEGLLLGVVGQLVTLEAYRVEVTHLVVKTGP